ncbi:MAG TPA: hypothetical protein RMG48_08485 [Myxococcales bacterium LLY-WYZ-16_1]|nr:hypothetical protein [Myxococcales bacterium LLY-WYZ-16_1]
MLRPGPAWAALLAVWVLPVEAEAQGVDIRLGGTRGDGSGILFRCPEGSPCVPNDRAFRAFVSELGQVFAPRLWSPAATSGRAGFRAGLAWSGSFVSDEAHWRLTERGQAENRPTEFLHAMHLVVRKGLPWSFEVGAQLTWMLESDMVAPGLELRWAFREGIDHFPDLALRTAVSTLLGSRDLDLTAFTADFVVSRDFAVASVAELSPFLAWGIVFTAARSDVIDPTPGTFASGTDGVLRPDRENDFVFDPVRFGDLVDQRLSLGVRARFYGIEWSVQGDVQMFADGQAFGPVGTVSTQLGLIH